MQNFGLPPLARRAAATALALAVLGGGIAASQLAAAGPVMPGAPAATQTPVADAPSASSAALPAPASGPASTSTPSAAPSTPAATPQPQLSPPPAVGSPVAVVSADAPNDVPDLCKASEADVRAAHPQAVVSTQGASRVWSEGDRVVAISSQGVVRMGACLPR